jgi:DNA-binding XRE family transcriptional regulator
VLNTPTSHQILTYNGRPAFAVIPYSEYLQLMEHTEIRPDEEVTLPHEVVKMSTIGGMSLIRAWREHLALTQEEVARRMSISQPAYAKLEGGKTRPRIATCKRLAAAMGVEWEQLTE